MEFKMNGDMLNLIDCTVKKAVSDAVSELKRSRLISENRQNAFQKTETLLYQYKDLMNAVKDKEEKIIEIRNYGVRKRSTGLTSYAGNEGFVDVKSEQEKAEEEIEAIERSISKTKRYLQEIDDAINSVSDDPYFEIIRLRYFDRKNREEIAEYFDCDVRTVTRNKNRLVQKLQIKLFSDQVLQEILFG